MLPLIVEVDRTARALGLGNGQDSELVHLRCDQMLRLMARGIQGPTGWSFDEIWLMIAEASE
jgi:hypothetical protein